MCKWSRHLNYTDKCLWYSAACIYNKETAFNSSRGTMRIEAITHQTSLNSLKGLRELFSHQPLTVSEEVLHANLVISHFLNGLKWVGLSLGKKSDITNLHAPIRISVSMQGCVYILTAILIDCPKHYSFKWWWLVFTAHCRVHYEVSVIDVIEGVNDWVSEWFHTQTKIWWQLLFASFSRPLSFKSV